jgi:hypothetical protein
LPFPSLFGLAKAILVDYATLQLAGLSSGRLL